MNRKDEIALNLAKVKTHIPNHVKLIVVTKTFPPSDVKILKELGVHDFGENRDQEGSEKSKEVEGIWHFQGQLQSNKLKSICGWANVIHSVDSLRYVELVDKATSKPIEVFIQVSLNQKLGRGGADQNDLSSIARAINNSNHLKLLGLMAVAPLGEPAELAFSKLAKIHEKFRNEFPDSPYLSAGMSGDFKEAIAHGATHVRIGSSILGTRPAVR